MNEKKEPISFSQVIVEHCLTLHQLNTTFLRRTPQYNLLKEKCFKKSWDYFGMLTFFFFFFLRNGNQQLHLIQEIALLILSSSVSSCEKSVHTHLVTNTFSPAKLQQPEQSWSGQGQAEWGISAMAVGYPVSLLTIEWTVLSLLSPLQGDTCQVYEQNVNTVQLYT